MYDLRTGSNRGTGNGAANRSQKFRAQPSKARTDDKKKPFMISGFPETNKFITWIFPLTS